jgi:hypothetical protein
VLDRGNRTERHKREEHLVAEELDTYTPNGPAPMVTPDGSAKLTSRRPGRELFPATWLRHRAEVTYDGGSISGLLLEFCSTGLIVQAGGSKRLVSWDALQVVELAEG